LHCVVRYSNDHPEDLEYCKALVNMMMEAGNDPRIRNRAQQKPFDLVDARKPALRETFLVGEQKRNMERDIRHFAPVEEEADEGPTGSASDSDWEEQAANAQT